MTRFANDCNMEDILARRITAFGPTADGSTRSAAVDLELDHRERQHPGKAVGSRGRRFRGSNQLILAEVERHLSHLRIEN